MDSKDLKFVVGSTKEGEPATIRFYGYICEDSCRQFNEEFLYLQDYVKPSKIIISINSEGGSVLYGMGTFSIIQNSTIPTETVVEGIAASMASVLWAAGNQGYMRDYSLLMIHNPFMKNKDCGDPDTEQTVQAFQKQIETVYSRRFHLKKDDIKNIMSGAEGCDGTYLTAQDAVAAGILPSDHIIQTCKQIREKVKNEIKSTDDAVSIQKVMALVNEEAREFKPAKNVESIPSKDNIENSKINKMNEDKETKFAFEAVLAKLGLPKDSDVTKAVDTINALSETKKDLKKVTDSFNELKIVKEGLDAKLVNMSKELDSVKNELATYKKAEEEKLNAEIAQTVDNAITQCKISKESRESWIAMAKTNFEQVKATLDSIATPKVISKEISNCKENIEGAKNNLSETELKMKERVDSVLGEDFQFGKF